MTGRPASEVLGLRFGDPPRVTRATLAIAVVALWLLGRRYEGLVHDAILYAGIGLRRLEPAALSGDFFFASGGQEAVITGIASIGGMQVVAAISDFRFIGGSMGFAVGERIVGAMDRAASRGDPTRHAALCADIAEVPGPAADPALGADLRQQVQRLLQLIEQLPAAQREAFLLQHESEMSIEEIAAATGVNRETAKSRLRYALAKLREGLKQGVCT